jgi:hypothetical protein
MVGILFRCKNKGLIPILIYVNNGTINVKISLISYVVIFKFNYHNEDLDLATHIFIFECIDNLDSWYCIEYIKVNMLLIEYPDLTMRQTPYTSQLFFNNKTTDLVEIIGMFILPHRLGLDELKLIIIYAKTLL